MSLFHSYSRYIPGLADQVNLQDLIAQLGDFLLQSGMGGGLFMPWDGEEDAEDGRSLDALKQAIMQALMESGQLTPEMLRYLRGESTGDEE
ncbi:MAG TPA: hypothetical protein VLL51_07325, partial [Gemmatimonadales bacterium]|nr:hypothetical protein [Gemmatimonadales bacterium]